MSVGQALAADGVHEQQAARVQENEPLPARAISAGEPLSLVPDTLRFATADRAALDRWTRDYTAWEAWMMQWYNRTEPGWFSGRPRRPKPEPPAWLPELCAGDGVDEEWLARACTLLDNWSEDFATKLARQKMMVARADHEVEPKTVWWQHVHVDALWPLMRAQNSGFGVFGTHVTMDVYGRFQIFTAPGFIMLNVPSISGRVWTPATDWGFAYRLGTFVFPGTTGKATLHVNFAHAWVFGGADTTANGNVDIAGFSLTFSRPPKARK